MPYEQQVNSLRSLLPFNFLFREALAKMSKFQESILDADTAIELNPNSAEVYFLRGQIKMILKRFEEAMWDFKKVQQLYPGISLSEC